jgi:PAS domain S-box-containing protein
MHNKTKQKSAAEMQKELEEKTLQLEAARKEWDEARRELGEYKDMLRVIPEIIFKIDPDGRFTFISESVRALGYDPKLLIGKHFNCIIHPDDYKAASREHILPALQGKRTGHKAAPRLFDERRTGDRKTKGLEIRILKKNWDDGQKARGEGSTPVEVSSFGQFDRDVTDKEKKFLGSVGIIRDLKEDGKADGADASARKENEYQSLIDLIPDIIYRTDPDGYFTFVNDSVKKLGYEPSELIGRHFSVLLPSDYEEMVSRAKVLPRYFGTATGDENAPKLFDERRTGRRKTIGLEVPILTKPGEGDRPACLPDEANITAEVTASGFYEDDEAHGCKTFLGTVGIIRDVTHKKKAQEELIKKNRELDDFAFIVSHELKSPLKIIEGYLMAIRDNREVFEKYFDKVIGQSRRMASLVDSLLKLSQAGRVIDKRRNVDVEKVISRTFDSLKTKGIPCSLQLSSPMPGVKADPDRLEDLFHNLIDNSFKYRDPEKESLTVRIDCQQTGRGFLFTYQDNGIGIRKEYQRRLFEPGFVLEKDKGTGFGLAIARKIIQAHGGNIWADSPGLGGGITFYFMIPH